MTVEIVTETATDAAGLRPSQKLRVAMATNAGAGLALGPGFAKALLAEVAALERRADDSIVPRVEKLLAKADQHLRKALMHLAFSIAVFFLSLLLWVL